MSVFIMRDQARTSGARYEFIATSLHGANRAQDYAQFMSQFFSFRTSVVLVHVTFCLNIQRHEINRCSHHIFYANVCSFTIKSATKILLTEPREKINSRRRPRPLKNQLVRPKFTFFSDFMNPGYNPRQCLLNVCRLCNFELVHVLEQGRQQKGKCSLRVRRVASSNPGNV